LGPKAVGAEPPRIAAKFWDEYKQRLLDTFFGKKAEPDAKATPAQPQTSQATSDPTPSATLGSEHAHMLRCAVPSASELLDDRESSGSQASSATSPSASVAAAKRKRDIHEPVASSSKKSKKDNLKPKKPGQTSLASFFSKSTSSSSKANASASGTKSHSSKEKLSAAEILEADYKLALSLSQESSSPRASGTQSNGESKKAWSTLLAPVQPPLCQVHGEPTKELTVNKAGPNKGKNFFICSR
jgi:AP endonuclease-2